MYVFVCMYMFLYLYLYIYIYKLTLRAEVRTEAIVAGSTQWHSWVGKPKIKGAMVGPHSATVL